MKKKGNDVIKGLLIFSGVMLSIAGALTILYKVFTKHFKVSIEMCPDDDDECPCDECNKSDDIEFDLSSDSCDCGEEPDESVE